MELKNNGLNRRAFLGAAGLLTMNANLVRGFQANSAVRVGLLGCGGRGTADASSMLINAGARVVALVGTPTRRRPKPRSKRGAKCPAMRVPQCGHPPAAVP